MARQSPPIPAFALYGEETDFPDLLHIETIDDRAPRHGWAIAPHRHLRLHQFVFLAAGAGTVTLDGQAHRLSPPVVVNLPPRTVHSFALQEGTEGDVVTLPVPIWSDLLLASPEAAPALQTPFLAPSAASLGPAIGRLRAELRNPGAHRALRLRVAVGAFVLALLDVQAAVPPAEDMALRSIDPRLLAFRAAIDDTPRITLTVAGMARTLGVSERHLSRLCLDGAGQSAQALIHAGVTREACRLLAYTRLQIAEIGHSLGFDDPSYFSRFFVKNTGVSPRDYRARLNG